ALSNSIALPPPRSVFTLSGSLIRLDRLDYRLIPRALRAAPFQSLIFRHPALLRRKPIRIAPTNSRHKSIDVARCLRPEVDVIRVLIHIERKDGTAAYRSMMHRADDLPVIGVVGILATDIHQNRRRRGAEV